MPPKSKKGSKKNAAAPRQSSTGGPTGPQSLRGCCCESNCCVTVPQDKWVVLERFGAFQRVLGPGFHWIGLDVCNCCFSMRSLSNRVVQQEVTTTAKQRDGWFVCPKVAVQMKVDPERVERAFYRLDDVQAQVESYVTDIVQAAVQSKAKGTVRARIEKRVAERLQPLLEDAGFLIEKVLLTGFYFADQGLAAADQEIAKARLEKESAKEEAEAAKVRQVKAAEAAADAARLQGEGTARQRAAILQGLRDSFESQDDKLGVDKATELLLTTQYFSTLRELATGPNSRTIFLPWHSQASQALREPAMPAAPSPIQHVML